MRAVATIALAFLACASVAVGATDTDPVPATYVLSSDSVFQRGCFDPCDCLLATADELRGKFRLAHAGVDPLFDYYDVTDVAWTAMFEDGTELAISGSGTYQIGGEFALQHRLSLDLAVGDEPVAHFDSGLVVGGSQFPALDVQISINGVYCFDTVIDLVAKPVPMLEVDDAALLWSPVPTALHYDVVRGDLSVLHGTGGDFAAATVECVAGGVEATATPFVGEPATGEGFWFAVRGCTVAAEGSYDSGFPSQVGSRDPGIEAGPSCP